MKNILIFVCTNEDKKESAKEAAASILRTGIFDSVMPYIYSEKTDGEPLTCAPAAVFGCCRPELSDTLRRANDGELPANVFVAGDVAESSVLMAAADLSCAGVRPIVLSRLCPQDAEVSGLCSLAENSVCVTAINSRRDIVETSGTAEVRLVETLKRRGLHISFAESCTGGKAAARLIGAPSASSVIDASFVTYANEAKEKFVFVSPAVIEKYGAVSEAVAGEMAKGAAIAAEADIGVGISGIAGPDGGTPQKPVGTVCFGYCILGELTTETVHFEPKGREYVREASVDRVFSVLLDKLGA